MKLPRLENPLNCRILADMLSSKTPHTLDQRARRETNINGGRGGNRSGRGRDNCNKNKNKVTPEGWEWMTLSNCHLSSRILSVIHV